MKVQQKHPRHQSRDPEVELGRLNQQKTASLQGGGA